MDSALYVAVEGAKAALRNQTINANNLANVKTTGFRADLQNTESRVLVGDSFPTRVYVSTSDTLADFTPGSIRPTDRDLDIAVQGEGWIAVQSSTGQEAYTRMGSFQINETGQLQTSTGHPVIGNGGVIALPPAAKVMIGTDGTISIRPVGQDSKSLVTIDRIKLTKPDPITLGKGEDGLFYIENDGIAEADASVKVVHRALEDSNVNPIGIMVDMIAQARQFEMHMNVVRSLDQSSQITEEILAMQ